MRKLRDRNLLVPVAATGATLLLAMLWLFPLLWAVLTSLKSENQAIAQPIVWLPHPLNLSAFRDILTLGNLPRWYFNSALTSLAITALTLALSVTAAYAFSQLRFPGKQVLFWFMLAGIMIPFEALLIPLFKLMNSLNTVNTYAGIILPQLVAPVALFVFKQFFDQIPRELREAALIDGAGELRVIASIYMPLSSNIIWALGIVTFIGAWNNFLWPLIITTSSEMMTIPLGLTQVQDAYGLRYARTMAAAVLGGLPVAVLYLIFQRRVTEGFLSATGLKG